MQDDTFFWIVLAMLVGWFGMRLSRKIRDRYPQDDLSHSFERQSNAQRERDGREHRDRAA